MDSRGTPIESSTSSVSNSVGMLDLTETVVQSLVLDVPNITFTVCESRKSAMERLSITEAMPLAQSTAMDEEYGVTAKPEVTSFTVCLDNMCKAPTVLLRKLNHESSDDTMLYHRRPTLTEYRDLLITASWTCRILT